MEWIVNIEGRPRQRILVKYYPELEAIDFKGQYKTKFADYAVSQNPTWVDFYCKNYTTKISLSLETTKHIILTIIEEMDERIKVHEELRERFEIIKNIEIRGINEI
jgi:hypothetical protein